MQKILLIAIFIIILTTFLADPAPVSLEFADLILIGLPFYLGIFALATHRNFVIYKIESDLLIAIMLYLSYLLLSVIIAFVQGIPIFNILRAIGPYINFFPLLFISLLPGRVFNPWSLAIILIIIGLFQGCYQIYLYLTHSNNLIHTLDVLRNRITLIDPRTTLPIVITLSILPIVFFPQRNSSNKRLIFLKLVIGFITFLGIFAAIATLTRAIVLAIFFGWILLFILYLQHEMRKNVLVFLPIFKKFFLYLLLFSIIVVILLTIPKIQILIQGLLARFYHAEFYSASHDYSNGRLFDEWLPALTVWMHSNIFTLFFGIGAGNTFTIPTREERTYIHNLLIYSLVYGGIFGIFACLWLYICIFKTLIIRAIQTNQLIYLGFAALLGSLFLYGQLFAVHKGLAFNAMLFLIIAIALSQPAKQSIKTI